MVGGIIFLMLLLWLSPNGAKSTITYNNAVCSGSGTVKTTAEKAMALPELPHDQTLPLDTYVLTGVVSITGTGKLIPRGPNYTDRSVRPARTLVTKKEKEIILEPGPTGLQSLGSRGRFRVIRINGLNRFDPVVFRVEETDYFPLSLVKGKVLHRTYGKNSKNRADPLIFETNENGRITSFTIYEGSKAFKELENKIGKVVEVAGNFYDADVADYIVPERFAASGLPAVQVMAVCEDYTYSVWSNFYITITRFLNGSSLRVEP